MSQQALKESIEHWEDIKSSVESGITLYTDDIDCKQCALCHEYCIGKELLEQCYGCPVFEVTGSRYCAGSPWPLVSFTINCVEDPKESLPYVIDQEILFLKSLVEAE